MPDQPYVTFPGTAGTYISTPDVNLLDADTAHLQQGVGTWVQAQAMSDFALAQVVQPIFGQFHAQGLIVGGFADAFMVSGIGVDGAPVSGSTVYTASLFMGADVDDMECRITIQWADAGGAFIRNDDGAYAACDQNALSQHSATFTSPSNAAFLTVIPYWRKVSGNTVQGDVVYWDAATVREGSDATFVPSLRIVGDIDITWDAVIESFPTDAYHLGISGVNGPRVYSNASTTRRLDINLGNSDVSLPTSTSWLVAGSRHVYRATRETNGAYVYYRDGAVDKSGVFTAGALTPQGGDAGVGARGDGGFPIPADFYSAAIRDGIDGPIVAQFDAADVGGVL